MDLFETRMSTLDVAALFGPIASQTTWRDKRSLLLVQRTIRARGPYTYLEIGSHLGGTVQTHYADPRCTHIDSIDSRPKFVPDVRGQHFHYSDNSTERMLTNLHTAYPGVDATKIHTFDCDAREIDPATISAPDLCFIDGEHTIAATLSDFQVCRSVASRDTVFLFHDTNLLTEAIDRIEADLTAAGIRHEGLLLAGCVYVLLTHRAIDWYADALRELAQDKTAKFAEWRLWLARAQHDNRWSGQRLLREILRRVPKLYDAARAVRNAVMRYSSHLIAFVFSDR